VNKLSFLYEDSDVFVVYKPAGLHSVRLPNGGGLSLADLLLAHNPALAHASRTPGDAGLVQRLDLETSGAALGAKNRPSWDALFKALLSGEIKKQYVALVEGRIEDQREVSSYLGSPHRGAKKVKVYLSEPAASARALYGLTRIEPIAFNAASNQTLVRVAASPARRHQVRAHLAHLGYPLVGDTLYGASSTLNAQRKFFLHAETISFKHPVSDEQIMIRSEYDEVGVI
jgi:23S rRNA-/tRNA-specific pseudouridylate synthase